MPKHWQSNGTVQNSRRIWSFLNAIGPSEWLTDGIDRMVSDQWLKCVKVRAAVLQNRLQESRYKPFTNNLLICAAGCRVNESLGHIVLYSAVAVTTVFDM